MCLPALPRGAGAALSIAANPIHSHQSSSPPVPDHWLAQSNPIQSIIRSSPPVPAYYYYWRRTLFRRAPPVLHAFQPCLLPALFKAPAGGAQPHVSVYSAALGGAGASYMVVWR